MLKFHIKTTKTPLFHLNLSSKPKSSTEVGLKTFLIAKSRLFQGFLFEFKLILIRKVFISEKESLLMISMRFLGDRTS